jgi:hypothetical protein
MERYEGDGVMTLTGCGPNAVAFVLHGRVRRLRHDRSVDPGRKLRLTPGKPFQFIERAFFVLQGRHSRADHRR